MKFPAASPLFKVKNCSSWQTKTFFNKVLVAANLTANLQLPKIRLSSEARQLCKQEWLITLIVTSLRFACFFIAAINHFC